MRKQKIQFITDKMPHPVPFPAPHINIPEGSELSYVEGLFVSREDLEEIILNFSDDKFIKFMRTQDE